ncbi:unnamed protein product [Pedinophyceae sp. YPF-701]|nr:unnamed protein product [Pedinophyceae sp. YPF-701]
MSGSPLTLALYRDAVFARNYGIWDTSSAMEVENEGEGVDGHAEWGSKWAALQREQDTYDKQYRSVSSLLEERVMRDRSCLSDPAVRAREIQMELLDKELAALKSRALPPLTALLDDLAPEEPGLAPEEREHLEEFAREPEGAWEKQVGGAFRAGSEVVARNGPANLVLTGNDVATLRGLGWLNDEVMNCYLALLQARDTRWREEERGTPKCHFFNTFFFAKLYYNNRKYDYAGVKRWTKTKAIQRQGQKSECVLDCDLLLVPVHLGNHWTCAAVDLRNKALHFLDSLGGACDEALESMACWVRDEYKDKRGEVMDVSDWERTAWGSDCPQQDNCSDCGVFSLMFANLLSRGLAPPLQYELDGEEVLCADRMPYFRKRVAYDILQQRVD